MVSEINAKRFIQWLQVVFGARNKGELSCSNNSLGDRTIRHR